MEFAFYGRAATGSYRPGEGNRPYPRAAGVTVRCQASGHVRSHRNYWARHAATIQRRIRRGAPSTLCRSIGPHNVSANLGAARASGVAGHRCGSPYRESGRSMGFGSIAAGGWACDHKVAVPTARFVIRWGGSEWSNDIAPGGRVLAQVSGKRVERSGHRLDAVRSARLCCGWSLCGRV